MVLRFAVSLMSTDDGDDVMRWMYDNGTLWKHGHIINIKVWTNKIRLVSV